MEEKNHKSFSEKNKLNDWVWGGHHGPITK